MAVEVQQPTIRITVADETGSVGYFGLHLASGASIGAGRLALAQLRQVAPTGLAPVAGQIRIDAIEDSPAPGGGDGRLCGVFIFKTVTAGQLAVISVPGLRPEVASADDPIAVDLAHPAVSAFIEHVINAGYCNPWGHKLTECVAGLIEVRKLK